MNEVVIDDTSATLMLRHKSRTACCLSELTTSTIGAVIWKRLKQKSFR